MVIGVIARSVATWQSPPISKNLTVQIRSVWGIATPVCALARNDVFVCAPARKDMLMTLHLSLSLTVAIQVSNCICGRPGFVLTGKKPILFYRNYRAFFFPLRVL